MSFKKFKDLILGVVMLLFSGFYLYFAQQIKTRPKLTPSYASAQIVPVLLGTLLAVLSVIMIVQSVLRLKKEGAVSSEDTPASDKSGMISVALTFAVMIIYTLVLPVLGFCLSTFVYLLLQILILAPKEKRNIKLFVLISVVFTAVVFVVFRIGLQQLLPRGIIESLLGF